MVRFVFELSDKICMSLLSITVYKTLYELNKPKSIGYMYFYMLILFICRDCVIQTVAQIICQCQLKTMATVNTITNQI